MSRSSLLITGCNGLIGRILWESLEDEYELFGLDLAVPQGNQKMYEADVAEPDQVAEVFKRLPASSSVIHLAGDARVEADWDSAFRINLGGTKHIYEAARAHGMKRIILASSNHVTGAYEGFPPSLHSQPDPAPLTVEMPARPDGFYGWSKAAGELLARMYYDRYGLESICLRIGSVIRDDDPGRDARYESTWLSHRDLNQLVRKSLSTRTGFGIYYGVSNNRKRFWDISNAEAELDYHPVDDASTRIQSHRKEGNP